MGERPDTTMKGGHNRSSEDIRNDIRRTRGEMGSSIDELQYRFSPDYVRYRVKEVSMDKGRGLMGRIKENPLPAAIAGLGLAMLFRPTDHRREREKFVVDVDAPAGYPVYAESSAYTRDEHGMADTAREKMHNAGDAVKDRVHDTSESVRDAGHRASESVSRSMNRASSKARELSSRTRRGAMHAREDFWESFMENPLVLGAAGLAVGALFGAIIPETDKEDELMGEAAERVRRQVKDEARERGEQVKNVASAAAGAAKDSATRAARDQARREGLTGDGRDTASSMSSSPASDNLTADSRQGNGRSPIITDEDRQNRRF